jgi:3-keto-5-aminohexanoate cleavage enzyme
MDVMAAGTLITVAPTGAETAKSDAPALPVTVDELVTAAKACEAAGAAVIHVHLRDDDAQPTLDLGRAREAVTALRESTGLVVQISSGGAVTDPFEARLGVLDCLPDGASLTCGTVNFGADVFMNPWSLIEQLYLAMRERQIVPEFELFDLGHVTTMRRLLDKHGAPYGGRVHCDLVMGVPGGMPGTAAALVACVAALPPEATWSATGVGRTTLPVMLAALSAGGHLRVGMEDTLTFGPGQPVRDNEQLVVRAAGFARHAQRPPMSSDEARTMLGIRTNVEGSVVPSARPTQGASA